MLKLLSLARKTLDKARERTEALKTAVEAIALLALCHGVGMIYMPVAWILGALVVIAAIEVRP